METLIYPVGDRFQCQITFSINHFRQVKRVMAEGASKEEAKEKALAMKLKEEAK